MRFESLSLRVPGDELYVEFHERLTILAGLGAVERQGFVEALLTALCAGHGSAGTELAIVGSSPRRILVRHEGDQTHYLYEDGSPANPLELPCLDLDTLRKLTRLGPAELGLGVAEIDVRAVPQLAEAQAALARLTAELETAFAAHQSVKAMADELTELEERVRQAEEGWAERHYAALLADLDQVRAEAASLRRGHRGGDGLLPIKARAEEAQDLARRFLSTQERRRQLQAQFGDRPRLDEAVLAATPPGAEDGPVVIDGLVRQLADAERRRDELGAQLHDVTVSTVGEPGHPAVVPLARTDQTELWQAAQQAVDAAERLEQQSIALGGVRTDGVSSPVAQQIEETHDHVVRAERAMEERTRLGFLASGGAALVAAVMTFAGMPVVALAAVVVAVGGALWMLVVPRRAYRRSVEAETEALERAEVSTYLSFHLRRIEATVDPRARQRLAEATAAHEEALAAWHRLAGSITPVQALALKEEVLGYAKAMADDPATAIERAKERRSTDVLARLQRDLEAAETEELALGAELEQRFVELGLEGDDLATRLEALDRVLLMAGEPEAPWASTRSLDEVEAELAALDARAERERPATWGTGAGAAALLDEEELDALRRRHQETMEAYARAHRQLPDVADLADRRSALERRVTSLEAAASADAGGNVAATGAAVEGHVVAWLESMATRTARGELLPLLLDDPFSRLKGESKWEVLDALDRLGERAQLLYLTDDPDVVLWARRRAGDGSLRLLEPNTTTA